MPQSRSAQGRDAGLAAWQKRFMEMLETSGVLSPPRLAAAFREVPRHLFVDRYYERVKGRLRVAHVAPAHPTPKQLRRIYRDDVLMTAATRDSESTNSQPSLVAQMVRDLQLDSGMSVLEIGAGTPMAARAFPGLGHSTAS
jgi:protein-L-isoaspartate O-methyltransferase